MKKDLLLFAAFIFGVATQPVLQKTKQENASTL